MRSLRSFAASFLLAAVVAGCGRNDIQVYRVSKDSQKPDDQAAQQAAMPAASQAAPRLQWKTPSGWQEMPPGEMRVASFRVTGESGKQAEVSVIPLPGFAGSDVDNVNRWRGQVGQPPVSQEEVAKLAQSVQIGDQTGKLYDQAGDTPGSGDKARILAAMLPRDGIEWFFKMIGDDKLVEQQKPAFLEFLKSVAFPAATAQESLPASHPPIDAGLLSGQASPSPDSTQAKPAWQVPAGWHEAPASQFLVAKFTIAGDNNAAAAVNVSESAGEGGGLLLNVNRWRGQLGLAPLGESEINQLATPVDTTGGKAILIDMTGTDARTGQKARLVAAIVPQGGQTWFYKLMGDEQLVQQQKDAFTKLVQTAKY
ncbi:MAG TPA: hypothetical protein VG146_07115 [Verrucomicrobiae bacterium]|nr:hypothetical protein [Verrucomicrobiae bacterium]